MHFLRGESSKRPRGTVLVLTAVCLSALLGMAALTVDVGYIYGWAHHAQNTADAGALAGASALRVDDWESAMQRAYSVVAQNQRAFGYLSKEDVTVQLGQWNRKEGSFAPLAGLARENANAVRVVSSRRQLPLFFARLLGKHTVDVAREAVALVGKPCGGIWGLDEAVVSGNVVTDSFDSASAPYSEVTAGDKGDVCSGGDVTVAGSLEINGDLMSGIDYSVIVRGNAADISGSIDTATDIMEVPAMDFEHAALFNDNDLIGLTDGGEEPFSSPGHFRIPGNDNLTLLPGVYYFESFRVGSGSTLTLNGPINIYNVGDFDMQGHGIVNTTEDPANLTIISMGTTLRMEGTVTFYGSILAPSAEVTLGGTAEMFGALIGKTVDLKGDFNFHVDESLALTQMIQPGPPVLVK